MRIRASAVVATTVILAVGGCAWEDEPRGESEVIEVLDLPAPDREGVVPLETTLAERRSAREFSDRSLELAELGQLLWAAQGSTGQGGGRTNPSAGALYPLEIYVAIQEGLYHYLSGEHRAELLSSADHRSRLSDAALGQEAVRDAPAVFVICGVFGRTEARYGERAGRYVHLEAGHVGQSLLLQAVALDLGAVPIGAFDDSEVQALLALPDDHEPLYLIPVGHPAD